ncbi:antidote-toxin recognition MazE family protein [Hydrogenophaga sp. RAC07]|uniref:antitoxin n=1 Tax=Hydrogenophaga sp. RAC07 TaxID=1842537 RepID=UPI00083E4C0C|nr:type II toxin-antitoxin system VapB family antitoxin [Hydrogenophaga sp. RAC07]AOF86680.1 antidote-toxin recognition MazE family protein [Hydrogenophaga sp. RAC07]
MNKPLKAEQLAMPSQFTTVFTSGNSQAVRLPKAFRFNDKTVEILRRGDEVILRPRRPTLREVMADLPPLSKEEAAQWDAVMAEVRADQGELRELDWSWLSSDEPTPTRPSSRRSATAKKSPSTKVAGKRRS